MARIFDSDDMDYLTWLEQHPDSFVVNLHRNPRSDYAVLHRSDCAHIRNDRAIPGAYTERGYKKLWASTVGDAKVKLQIELKDKRADFSKPCGHCHPL